MEKNKKTSIFYVKWFVLYFLSGYLWFLAVFFASMVNIKDFYFVLLWIFPMSVLIGVLQWWGMRKDLDRAGWWIPVTAIPIMICGITANFLFADLNSQLWERILTSGKSTIDITNNYLLIGLGSSISMVLAGFFVGLMQWRYLRMRNISANKLWIIYQPISLLTLIIFYLPIIYAIDSLDRFPVLISSLIFILIIGLLYAFPSTLVFTKILYNDIKGLKNNVD